MNQKANGFTIVELLIVIVVVGILAAISIVAYSGVSNQASDSALKSDLANFAKQISLIHSESGRYPAGGRSYDGVSYAGDYSDFPGVSFRPTRSAYFLPTDSQVNLAYCEGPLSSSGARAFNIIGKSKSGAVSRYSSSGGLEQINSGTSLVLGNICAGISTPYSFSYGYIAARSGWQPWTN